MPKYICGATSDIGVGREQQEDFVQFCELDEETLLCIVADGTGSMPQRPQPASIVAMDIIENIKDSFEKKPDLLIKYPKFFRLFGKCNMLLVFAGPQNSNWT